MSSGGTGGSGAVLGAKVLRYSGIQGALLVTSNLLTFASVVVVAFFLGPAEFGRFGLLLFLAGLLNMLFNLATKQGTFKRVFGMDDEDEDDEDSSAAEAGGDRRSLGTGLWLTTAVSLAGTGLAIAFAGPIAELLLGGEGNRELVAFAAVTGGLGAVFRLSSLVLWLERRPGAHVAVEVARPLLVLAAVIAFVASGAGLEGAIAGTAIGTAASVALALVLLRGSYDPRPTLLEAGEILRRGAPRIPVVLSMWTMTNADIFILSRFVSDADLGVYQLASRTAIVVALLPGGFRIAMRPLRKSLSFRAVQDQYGRAIARGQQLTYFLLLCIFALFSVTLASEVLAHLVPSGYADAAPLVPLIAAGAMGTSVVRSISQAVSIPAKRITFILGVVAAALTFIGSALVLVPELGLEGAPIAMLIGFSVPSLFMLGRSQLGSEPIQLAYGRIAAAALLAAALAAAYELLGPERGYLQLALAIALFGGYVALLPALGIVPRQHWAPLAQIVRAQFGGGRGSFDPARALESLDDADRVALRLAIVKRRPVAEIPERLARRGLIADEPPPDESPPDESPPDEPPPDESPPDEPPPDEPPPDEPPPDEPPPDESPPDEPPPDEPPPDVAVEGGAGAVRVVTALRRAAAGGGTPIREGKKAARRWGSPAERDAVIAGYLFPAGTVAQRDALMRRMLDEGVRSDELMALESVLDRLASAPKGVWKGRG